MLYYGKYIVDNCKVFNIGSYREGFQMLRSLIPPNELGKLSGRDFDLAYANYIMNNDIVFGEFFQIIYHLYIGVDVYLLISNDEWIENLIESLLKLIQQRYGYNAYRIENIDDITDVLFREPTNFAPGYGLFNLDQDKERYTYVVESLRMRGYPNKWTALWIL